MFWRSSSDRLLVSFDECGATSPNRTNLKIWMISERRSNIALSVRMSRLYYSSTQMWALINHSSLQQLWCPPLIVSLTAVLPSTWLLSPLSSSRLSALAKSAASVVFLNAHLSEKFGPSPQWRSRGSPRVSLSTSTCTMSVIYPSSTSRQKSDAWFRRTSFSKPSMTTWWQTTRWFSVPINC